MKTEEEEATAEIKFIPSHRTSPVFLWFTGSRAWGQFLLSMMTVDTKIEINMQTCNNRRKMGESRSQRLS